MYVYDSSSLSDLLVPLALTLKWDAILWVTFRFCFKANKYANDVVYQAVVEPSLTNISTVGSPVASPPSARSQNIRIVAIFENDLYNKESFGWLVGFKYQCSYIDFRTVNRRRRVIYLDTVPHTVFFVVLFPQQCHSPRIDFYLVWTKLRWWS